MADREVKSESEGPPEKSQLSATATSLGAAGGVLSNPENGYPVTTYKNTGGESVGRNGVKVILHNRDMWVKFHKNTTEMILTRAGRRIFPVLEISVANLDPEADYIITMNIVPVDENRYKFHDSEWVVTIKAALESPGRLYVHPDSPSPGAVWEKQIISFRKLKMTNNHLDQHGYLILNSMHKYQPRIHIVKTSDESQLKEFQQGSGSDSCSTHIFEETQFMAVTVYKNKQIAQLKKENPFAKGFRRRSGSGSGTAMPLGQLPHQHSQPPHFPYATSTNPQTANASCLSRQNMAYPVMQPLSSLTPSSQTVGYASPVTSTLAATVAFPSSDSFGGAASSSSQCAVTNPTSDSEQSLVSELITSISNNLDTAYPTDIPTVDTFTPTGTPPQQPHSADSCPSETLRHSAATQQNGMATMTYSPPSLTPSPTDIAQGYMYPYYWSF